MICIKCGIDKPLTEFRKRKDYDTYYRTCKKCAYANTAKWVKENPERNHFNKMRSNMNRFKHVKGISATELREFGYPDICHLCGKKIDSLKEAEIDHVYPLSKGGENVIENLKWTHRTCNRMKHDLTMDEFVKQMEIMLEYLKVKQS